MQLKHKPFSDDFHFQSDVVMTQLQSLNLSNSLSQYTQVRGCGARMGTCVLVRV